MRHARGVPEAQRLPALGGGGRPAMLGGRLSSPDRRTVRLLDRCLALWVALWIALGAWVGYEIHGLVKLSDTVVTAGRALESTGQTLRSFDVVPGLGGTVDRLSRDVLDTSRQAQASGRSSRGSVEQLSVLLGLCIALIPTVPLLALYLPARVHRARDVRAVRRGLRDGDPRLREHLARRAVAALPYRELRGMERDPWDALRDGRYDELADRELFRLGIAERRGHR
jgi:hypothetical protein